jgi:RNA polymerase sigma-70 factor (ECF subfamily)
MRGKDGEPGVLGPMADLKKKEFIERLFLQHGTALRAFFRRRVRVAPDASDLAQEVYLRMLSVRDTDRIRKPELYLYTVANNLLKEHRVMGRVRTACDIDDPAIQEEMAELPHFEHHIDTHHRVRRLHEVLSQLSPKCRATVVLQFRHGLSYEDIGARLGISTNMVKKYLAQAVDHCRRRMERLR